MYYALRESHVLVLDLKDLIGRDLEYEIGSMDPSTGKTTHIPGLQPERVTQHSESQHSVSSCPIERSEELRSWQFSGAWKARPASVCVNDPRLTSSNLNVSESSNDRIV